MCNHFNQDPYALEPYPASWWEMCIGAIIGLPVLIIAMVIVIILEGVTWIKNKYSARIVK